MNDDAMADWGIESLEVVPKEPVEAPSDLKVITLEAATLKAQIAKLESELKGKKEKMADICNEILRTLELLELDSIRAHGFLFFKEIKSSVQTPKTPEEKKQLFDFLESKGIFLEMVSINSITLNKLYKDMSEEAAEAGNFDFQIPGIAPATSYTNLKLKKG